MAMADIFYDDGEFEVYLDADDMYVIWAVLQESCDTRSESKLIVERSGEQIRKLANELYDAI